MKRASLFSAASIAVAAILLLSACEDVPSLRFVVDGGSDAGTTADAADAQAKDASGDAATGCPTTRPPGTDGCCGEVACYGNSCEAQCSKCTACTPTEYCCTSGSLRCITPGEQCH